MPENTHPRSDPTGPPSGADDELRTERLILRRWRPGDREPFARLNADPSVMEMFPTPLTREQSNEFIDRIEWHFDRHGWGLWAVEVADGEPFIGFVGLWPAGFDLLRGQDSVEVGWRLDHAAWGHGYATEAARAALGFAWQNLELEEIVSYTSKVNERSVAVMSRIGMTYVEEFDHPRLPEGHPLRRHVLYRITQEAADGSHDEGDHDR